MCAAHLRSVKLETSEHSDINSNQIGVLTGLLSIGAAQTCNGPSLGQVAQCVRRPGEVIERNKIPGDGRLSRSDSLRLSQSMDHHPGDPVIACAEMEWFLAGAEMEWQVAVLSSLKECWSPQSGPRTLAIGKTSHNTITYSWPDMKSYISISPDIRDVSIYMHSGCPDLQNQNLI